jgi:murein DD-endopeptidase MepM/ murein hydrolase activator NlpD
MHVGLMRAGPFGLTTVAVAAVAALAVVVAPPAAAAPVAAAPDAPGAPAAQTTYAWPLLPPPAVVTPFGAPENPFGPGHRGVDLAGVVGQPVRAARGGTVIFAGPVAGHGVVSIQHDDGLRTTYEPLVATVHVGAVVATGAVLGTLVAGHRGCPSPCLHWGVRRDRLEYVDPLVLLRPSRVRLLPVPDPWPDS